LRPTLTKINSNLEAFQLVASLVDLSTINTPHKGVLFVAYFTITDGNGTAHEVDLLTNDPAMIAEEFKKFEAKQEANKKDQEEK